LACASKPIRASATINANTMENRNIGIMMENKVVKSRRAESKQIGCPAGRCGTSSLDA
jgi:hypothetical protein